MGCETIPFALGKKREAKREKMRKGREKRRKKRGEKKKKRGEGEIGRPIPIRGRQ